MDTVVGTCVIDTVGDGADILHVVCLSESRRWIQAMTIAAHEAGRPTTWPHPRWEYTIIGDEIEVTPSLRVLGRDADQFHNSTPWRVPLVRSDDVELATQAAIRNRRLIEEWQRKFV